MMSDSDEEPNGTSANGNGTPPTVRMFRCGGGGGSDLRGAFIQVPEECLVQTWDTDRPSRMAVLTTFSVRSIEETLRRVVDMGGRVHASVFLVIEIF